MSFGNQHSPMPQHSKAALSFQGWSDFAEEFEDKELTVIAYMGTISRPKQSVHVLREHLFVYRVLFFGSTLGCSNNLLIFGRRDLSQTLVQLSTVLLS